MWIAKFPDHTVVIYAVSRTCARACSTREDRTSTIQTNEIKNDPENRHPQHRPTTEKKCKSETSPPTLQNKTENKIADDCRFRTLSPGEQPCPGLRAMTMPDA